jgi:hypothetical protein
VASPEPSLSPAPAEAVSPDDDGYLDGGASEPSGSGPTARPSRSTTTARQRRLDPNERATVSAALREDAGLDDDLLSELSELTETPSIVTIEPVPDTEAVTGMIAAPVLDDDIFGDDDELDDADDEFVEVIDKSAARGKLKARKVRRVVRYVSPWSVLKVSLLFYACLWVILTIASVLLWRAAVVSGAIANVEKFLARVFGESEFAIDGREIFRASTLAGLILVFAGTGFTVMMSLLFNVICDITGGIRFTVLELETTKRLLKKNK